MRLIHIVPSISEEASGPSYSVVRLCESVIAQGQDVTLAALDWAPLPSPPNFLKTFSLGLGPRRLGRSPEMYRWLLQKATAQQIDVMHNHGMWQLNSVYPGWVARRTKVELVISPRGAFSEWAMNHGSRLKKLFWPLLQKPALDAATCFHATAESEYNDIRRLGFRQPIAVIPNGIDLYPLPVRNASQQRTLLFLGRIHSGKGLEMLLAAWQQVQRYFPDWRLVIAGSDVGYYGTSGYLEKIKEQAMQLNLNRVEFLAHFLA